MRQLNRFFDELLFFTTALTSSAFFIIIILAVTSRYIFKAPILASIELSRLLFVWSCFLAAALAYRRKAHVSISFIFEKFPHFLQRIVTIMLHILFLLFLCVILYQSILVTVLLWPSKLPMLQMTQSCFYLPLPFILPIMILYTLEFLLDDLYAKKD